MFKFKLVRRRVSSLRASRHRFQPGRDHDSLEQRDVPTLAPVLLAQSPVFQAPIRAAQAAASSNPFLRFFPYRATYSGQFFTGPGRQVGQSGQLYFSGSGGSNSYLHGDIQMIVVQFADPTQPTVARVDLIAKNVTNSGNQLHMDLQAVPGAVDKAGRPTQFSWKVDDGNSGGTFNSAQGSGTVQIHYMTKRANGKFPSGGFNMLFKGQIGINGIDNVLRPVSSVR